MAARRIGKERVLITLNDPDRFEKGSHANEIMAIETFAGKRVRVIYVSKPDEIRIITVTH